MGCPEHRRVAKMHAVEVAKSEGDASRIVGQTSPVVEYPHQARDGT
jgi:hypothetical protein